MPRLPASALGTTTAERVMGHRPELLQAWEQLERRFRGPVGDAFCAAQRRGPKDARAAHGLSVLRLPGAAAKTHANRQESLAAAFADAAAGDHTAISDAQVQLLSEEFTAPQIVELLMWISFEYAGQCSAA